MFPICGHDQASWLRHGGLAGDFSRSAGRVPRAAYEIDVICQGFPSYFLVVADLISYAQSAGAGGSRPRLGAAGSLVALRWRHRHRPDSTVCCFERFLPQHLDAPTISLPTDGAA